MTITPSQADAIWTILVECCGAINRADDRTDFLIGLDHGCTEYRFQGSLGFGGKLYVYSIGWRVSCYQEDETPERLAAIDAANLKLKALWESGREK